MSLSPGFPWSYAMTSRSHATSAIISLLLTLREEPVLGVLWWLDMLVVVLIVLFNDRSIVRIRAINV